MSTNANNGTSISKVSPAQATLKDLLDRATPALRSVLPKHLSAERLVKIALAATARDRKLMLCTPQSVLQSVMQASTLGLEPNSALGGAYLVPYGNVCQLIVGYRGLIDLARRSGQILSIEARVVHEREKFRIVFGINTILEHEPLLDGTEPGKMLAVYAVAHLRDGGTQVEVMTRAQIEGIKNRSRSGGNGPWVTDYEEMARKTVVRRICKYLPLSVEIAEALANEDRVESGEAHLDGVFEVTPDGETVEVAPPTAAPPKTASEIVDRAKAKKAAPAREAVSKNDDVKTAGFDEAPARVQCEACSRFNDEGHKPNCPNGSDPIPA